MRKSTRNRNRVSIDFPLEEDLSFALDVATQAGRLASEMFEKGVKVTIKDDNTPVTKADKDCEKLIRDAIRARCPQDAILGEEEGESRTESRRKWIVDPIDGTYNYARRIPIFATLLALEYDEQVVLGVIHNPALGETFWATQGSGAFRNGQPISVSKIDRLDQAHFVFGEPMRIMKQRLWDGFSRLIRATERHRGFGDYMSLTLVCEGKAEVAAEMGVKPWDLAPAKIICEEAGGRFSDLSGGESIYAGSCLISNGLVHDEALNLLLHR